MRLPYVDAVRSTFGNRDEIHDRFAAEDADRSAFLTRLCAADVEEKRAQAAEREGLPLCRCGHPYETHRGSNYSGCCRICRDDCEQFVRNR